MSMTEKFHVYDPGYGGKGIIAVRDTLDEAINEANATIKNNWQPDQGDEWSLDVTDVSIFRAPADCDDPSEDGVCVARATEVDRVDRPNDLDEDGFSLSTGDWWDNGYDYMCNYRVEPLRALSAKETGNG